MPVTRRTRRLRNAVVLPLVLAGVLLSGACSSSDDGPSGAESPRAAADAYVKALNGRDKNALRDLFTPGHSEDRRRAEAERLIGALGDDARLKVVDVTQDVSPKAASARLGGSTDEGEYTEYVQLSEDDDGWWVVPANTDEGAGSGPTAGTGQPSP